MCDVVGGWPVNKQFHAKTTISFHPGPVYLGLGAKPSIYVLKGEGIPDPTHDCSQESKIKEIMRVLGQPRKKTRTLVKKKKKKVKNVNSF